jgi:tetratricopeptide (TPR) repeat protein
MPGPRSFVDRLDLVASFDAALDREDGAGPKVLVFWGLAGIGKSRLRRELRDRLAGREDGTLWVEVDFGLPTLRDPQTALFSVRRQLSDRHGARFPTFDLVYACLWRMTRPNTAPLEEGKPLFEAGSIAASVLSSMGVPFVSLAAQLAEKASGPLKEWWIKRGREDLKGLTRLETTEIEERLPAYFAEDLSEYMSGQGRKAVFFFDTYEALFQDVRSEEQRLMRDEWFRELVLQLPSVLFVACGRERLSWAELDPEWTSLLEQHQVVELPETDVRTLLASAEVTDPGLQERILRETRNVPFLVDLALDTVDEMKKAGSVAGDDNPGKGATAEIRMSERFLRYLSPAEQDAVQVLAVPRYFDRPLFHDLCIAFETQFPPGQFSEICRFSFVVERSPGIFQMHDVMAEALRSRMARREPERLKGVHRFLFERFDALLGLITPGSVSPEQERAFLEAYHHARQTLPMAETVDWFIGRAHGFVEAGRDRLLLDAARALTADAEEMLGSLDRRTIESLAFLGGLNLPDPDESETALRTALERAREAGRPVRDLLPGILTHLARALSFRKSRFDEARGLLEEATRMYQESTELDEPAYCLAVASLSACLSDAGDVRASRDLCRSALARVQNDKANQYYRWVLNNLSYEDYVLGFYVEAERETRECYELMAECYTEDSYNLWTPVSTLGEIRSEQGRFEEAETFLLRSLELLELGEYVRGITEVEWVLADVYARWGKLEAAKERVRTGLEMAEAPRIIVQLLATQARIAIAEGSYEEAAELLKRSFSLGEPVVPADSPWYATTGLLWAELERKRGRDAQAEEYLRKALELVRAKLRPDHPWAGLILLEWAVLCETQGRAKEAARLREEGCALREKEGCVT